MKQPESRGLCGRNALLAGGNIQIDRHLPSTLALHSYITFLLLGSLFFSNQPDTRTPLQSSFTMTEFKQSMILCIAALLALTPNTVNALSATLVRLHNSQSCRFII